jgi:hypothetical protein
MVGRAGCGGATAAGVGVPAFLLVFCAAVVCAQEPGAFECLCIKSNNPLVADLSAAAKAKGLPEDYGIAGCKPYDQLLPEGAVGEGGILCSGQGKELCAKPWCYVDSTCSENITSCEAAGGTLGSYKDPSCRSRQKEPTQMFKNTRYANLEFSRATCGNLDTFVLSSVVATAGRTLQVAMRADARAPYTYPSKPFAEDPKNPHRKGYEGVHIDMMDEFKLIPSTLSPPLPNIMINISTEFGSKESRAKFPKSSYTACAYDVLLGNKDVCLGDFWVTAQVRIPSLTLPADLPAFAAASASHYSALAHTRMNVSSAPTNI